MRKIREMKLICKRQALKALFRNNFFGKQIVSSKDLELILEICFPKKLFLKSCASAACHLLNPLHLHYLPISFFLYSLHEKTNIVRVVMQRREFSKLCAFASLR